MLFPIGSLPDGPYLETRKALLVIDLQNDFVKEGGKLFVKNARDFLPKLPTLAAKFREKGDVFWVHTEFKETRPTISPDLGSSVVILEKFLDERKCDELEVFGVTEQPEQSFESTIEDCGSGDPEAFLAQRNTAGWPRCCLPNTSGCDTAQVVASIIDNTRDMTIVKTDYSAFQAKSLLPTLRMKLITQLYLCGSLSNISVYATALDAVRHGLEVTVLEDCVGYRSTKCHEEAMRQMADAMGVNGTDHQELMDDLNDNLGDVVTTSTFKSAVGTRQTDGDDGPENYTMRVKIKGRVENMSNDTHSDGCGAERIDGFESASAQRRSLSNRTGLSVSPTSTGENETRPNAATAPQKRSSDEIDSVEPAKPVSPPPPNAKTSRVRMRRTSLSANEKSASPGTSIRAGQQGQQITSQPSIEADSDPDGSLMYEMSSLVDKAKAFGRTLRGSKVSRQPSTKTLGPGDFIGERDSRIIYDFVPTPESANDAFFRLRNDGESGEVRWQKMYHRSGEVPRLVAVQGEVQSDGSIPIYRHPADESPPLLPFSSTVQSIRMEVEKAVGHPVNHALIQLYRGGEDNISEHSDKTLDIVRGSFIVNVSLGAMRTMTLRAKKSASTTQQPDQQRRASAPAPSPHSRSGVKRPSQRIPLPHNSLFILGQCTNQIWLHAIRADKRRLSEKTEEELAYSGERISLTFRHIGTFINSQEGTIWGQGASSKTEAGAKVILGGQEAEKEGERLIRAFGQENHQSHEFDWQAQYGAGFDVVNFTTKGDTGPTGSPG